MNRLLFGGTFDPFHIGHYQMIVSAIEYFKSKDIENIEIYIIPTYKPYYKSSVSQSYEKRLEICNKIANRLSRKYNKITFFTSNIDEQLNTNYFIDTAKYFYSVDNNNYILIGEDEYIKFDTWKDYDKILKMYTLIVVERNKIPCIKLNSVLSVSSSQLRENPDLYSLYTPFI